MLRATKIATSHSAVRKTRIVSTVISSTNHETVLTAEPVAIRSSVTNVSIVTIVTVYVGRRTAEAVATERFSTTVVDVRTRLAV